MDSKGLDVSKVIVPEGYKVIIDPALLEKEARAKEIAGLEARIAEMKEPTQEELAEFGKISHPYYYQLRRLEELNG
jgi:hypothetical protein